MEKIDAADAVRDEYHYRCCECKHIIKDDEPMWTDENGYVRCKGHARGNGWTALS